MLTCEGTSKTGFAREDSCDLQSSRPFGTLPPSQLRASAHVRHGERRGAVGSKFAAHSQDGFDGRIRLEPPLACRYGSMHPTHLWKLHMPRAAKTISSVPTHRILTVVVPRQAERGPDNAIYGDLFDRADSVGSVHRVLEAIVATVLIPRFGETLDFRVNEYQSMDAPERAGSSILTTGGTPESRRRVKEVSGLATKALKHLQSLSFSVASQPDLFYGAQVSTEDFPDWPEVSLRDAILCMCRAAARGDLLIELPGGSLEPLDFCSESAPFRTVGSVVIQAEVTGVDIDAGSVGYNGRAVDGDHQALAMLDKHRKFKSRIATDAELRKLALRMAEKKPCQFEVDVTQDALQFRFCVSRWEPLADSVILDLR